jgi:TRAP-type C4-dicarboxylate transport system substrate-binding protein
MRIIDEHNGRKMNGVARTPAPKDDKLTVLLEQLIVASKKNPNNELITEGLRLILASLAEVTAALAPKKKEWRFIVKRNHDDLIESIEATQG